MKFLPLRYNLLFFGALAFFGVAVQTAGEGPIDLFLTIVVPLGALIGLNLGYEWRIERGRSRGPGERRESAVDAGMVAGFLSIIYGGLGYVVYSTLTAAGKPPLAFALLPMVGVATFLLVYGGLLLLGRLR